MTLKNQTFAETIAYMGGTATASRMCEPRAVATAKPVGPQIPVPDMARLLEYAERCHIAVFNGHPLVGHYATDRNVTLGACLKYGVGFDLSRKAWVFPVAYGGEIVGLKIHRGGSDVSLNPSWYPCGIEPKEHPRHCMVTTWPPVEAFNKSKPLYICEGECKTLRLLSENLQSISPTSGSSFSWLVHEVERVAGFDVFVIYDDDPAGHKFRDKTVAALRDHVKSIRAFTFKNEVAA